MTKSSEQLISRASKPASKTFKPVPYKIVSVANAGTDHERAGADTPAPYTGVYFDDWRRGDLVVVERITRSYYQKGPMTQSSTWLIGRRDTTPSAARHMVRFNSCYRLEVSKEAKLWRIVLRYLSAAEKLINVEFNTREELEAALDNPANVELRNAA